MKKLLSFVLIAFVALGAFASTLDFALTIGQGNTDWSGEGLGFSYGASLGLSKRVELDFTASSTLTPKPFSETVLMAEVGYSLLGDRNSGTRVSGANVNTEVAFGGFWNPSTGAFGPMVGITPLSTGNPSLGRRERLLRTEIGWDVKGNKAFVCVSLLDFDLYLKGTYRDYTR